MSSFIKKLNPITGQVEQIGGVTLVGIPSEKYLEYSNANGETKHYKLANAQMELNGKKLPLTVTIMKKTIDRMKESGQKFELKETYLTTISRVPSTTDAGQFRIFARMSHLQGAPTAHAEIADAFDWDEVVPEVVTANKEVTTTV